MNPEWRKFSQALLDCNSADGACTERTDFARQASVLALFCPEPELQLLFTLRSRHLNRHAGEVAFPGGMWEPGDVSLLDTALRETHEEIGLPPGAIEILGACRPRTTLAGTLVHPFVGLLKEPCQFTPDPGELDAIFHVPLRAFERGLQVRTDSFEREGRCYSVPAYRYETFEIWGFTAALTHELLKLMGETGILRIPIRNDL